MVVGIMIIQVHLSVVPVRAQVRKGINRLRNDYISDYTLYVKTVTQKYIAGISLGVRRQFWELEAVGSTPISPTKRRSINEWL